MLRVLTALLNLLLSVSLHVRGKKKKKKTHKENCLPCWIFFDGDFYTKSRKKRREAAYRSLRFCDCFIWLKSVGSGLFTGLHRGHTEKQAHAYTCCYKLRTAAIKMKCYTVFCTHFTHHLLYCLLLLLVLLSLFSSLYLCLFELVCLHNLSAVLVYSLVF